MISLKKQIAPFCRHSRMYAGSIDIYEKMFKHWGNKVEVSAPPEVSGSFQERLALNSKSGQRKLYKSSRPRNLDFTLSTPVQWESRNLPYSAKKYNEIYLKVKVAPEFKNYLSNSDEFFQVLEEEVKKLPKIDNGITDVISIPYKEDELSREEILVEQLMATSMHIGHHEKSYHFSMRPFVLGSRHELVIIDLEKTLVCLRRAISVVRETAANNGVILFVGSRPLIQHLPYECATKSQQFFVDQEWVVDTFSEREKILKNDVLPDLIVIFSLKQDINALIDADACNIPSIAICDTDCDATKVTWPIPANDDSLCSVMLIARALAFAAKEGGEIFSSKNKFQLPTPKNQI